MNQKQKSLERSGEGGDEECAKSVEIKLWNLDSKYKAIHHVQMILTHFGAEKPASLHGMTTKSVHRFGKNAGLCGPKPAEKKHNVTNNKVLHENRATAVWKFV